jgi:hypothetical protein
MSCGALPMPSAMPCPTPPPERLRQQLDFIVGALTLTMAESALKDTRIIAGELVRFAAAGLRAPVNRSQRSRRPLSPGG